MEIQSSDGLIPFHYDMGYGPQNPSSIPVLPPLKLGRSAYGNTGGHRTPGKEDYQPLEGGGFFKHNGSLYYNLVTTTGVWWLLTGDRPCAAITGIPVIGGYASPAVLPHTGVGGRLRIAIGVDGAFKWLDKFESIDVFHFPGSTRWVCRDFKTGVVAEVKITQFVKTFGFTAELEVSAVQDRTVEIRWLFGKTGCSPDFYWEFDETKPVRAFENKAGGADSTVVGEKMARLRNMNFGYTEVFAGLSDDKPVYGKCSASSLEIKEENAEIPDFTDVFTEEGACIMLASVPGTDSSGKCRSRFLCVWGYNGYSVEEVEKAYRRLEYRPFADQGWLEGMKAEWFDHWIGRGLQPEAKFKELIDDPGTAIKEAEAFWGAQFERLKIKTPDPLFDNAVVSTVARLRMQYEFPGILHGLMYNKYGKINCGYYGFDASGYHTEVENSLKLISGTQCIKGRQRYFTPAFALSPWAEEVNFYYVEQIWYHYRWTGDLEFLKAMWSSARRALEHALNVSDPDGDGIMTGYYEMWNCDTLARGGKCALHTAMGWAALRAAAEMAKILGDTDRSNPFVSGSRQGPYPPEYHLRYKKHADKVEEQFLQQLWNKDAGVWCSAEWNGSMRPHPASHEENYHIRRGLGPPMQNYSAMRYIRENLHLRLQSGDAVELQNAWWPIMWSHHYVADGDTCSSFHSACAAGDVNSFWPLLKSVANTAYTGSDTALYHATGSQSQEIDTMFVHAVIDGMFGIMPFLGSNLIVVRPSLPSQWDFVEISLSEISYTYKKSRDMITLKASTPVKRAVTVELPVESAVRSVRVNGREAAYSATASVNCCRVKIESPESCIHEFQVEIEEKKPMVEGNRSVVVGKEATFMAYNCEVGNVYDLQGKMAKTKVERNDGFYEIILTPGETGKYTVFTELRCSNIAWLCPLDLDVRKPWRIIQNYTPADGRERPAVVSPKLDREKNVLHLEVENNLEDDIHGAAEFTVCGTTFKKDVILLSKSITPVVLNLGNGLREVTPGSLRVEMKLGGCADSAEAVDWKPARVRAPYLLERLKQLDLRSCYTASLRNLYSPEFKWRIDYTGCGVGVDWREPLPEKDGHGYVLLSPPISQFEYGILPEQWECTAYWALPDFGESFETPPGIPFRTGGSSADKNVMALASTEPYRQLPSSVTIRLQTPLKLEKIYFLTANLAKTLKCYFPGGEVEVRYEDGGNQLFQLIPPYTMSCMVQDFCPTVLAIPFGRIENGGNPLDFGADPKSASLALSDITLDPSSAVKEVVLRCVASETIFGIMGITLLEAVCEKLNS